MLETLNPQPQDKILQLIAMFRDDPRTDKIDLGVGVYKDATGLTPVMRAVKAAEKQLWETEKTKTYTGLAGEPAYQRGAGDDDPGRGLCRPRGLGRDARRHGRDPPGAGADPHGRAQGARLDEQPDLAEPSLDREIPGHADGRVSLFRCRHLAASISRA
jgi:hypothetical protein